MSTSPPITHGLRFEETAFYVIHRRREFGPFDYEWTPDLRGVELTYCGRKYGEFCSSAQMCVDLREFRLPQRVVQVAVLTVGALLISIRRGDDAVQRRRQVVATLHLFGCQRFAESAAAALR